jgi:D-alanyl-D-alanine carboxypeptidase
MVTDLPAEIRETILDDPAGFLDAVAEVLDQEEELTWLVDKKHALAAAYAPDDLVDLNQYDELTLSRPDHRLRRLIMPTVLSMVEAARIDGVVLQISSAYRSYDYQTTVYRRWVDDLGQEEADRVSAQPGHSQHQLGTVIDFGCICPEIAETADGIWLAEHAWRYGFSLSYPSGYSWLTGYDHEPWHYRFIGMAATNLERRYFAGIQHYLLTFIDANRSELVARRHSGYL